MRLYSGPLSMFGAKAEMAAIEKNIDLEVVFVPFDKRKLYEPKHPEVLRVNPKAQVPVLVGEDVEIFDSTQIFEYFESLRPQPALWPELPDLCAKARLLEHMSDEIFFPNVASLMPRQAKQKSAEDIQALHQSIQNHYNYVDELLRGQNYLAGEFTYADIAFYSAMFFSSFISRPPSSNLSRLKNWRLRMNKKESVQKVMGAMAEFLATQGIKAHL